MAILGILVAVFFGLLGLRKRREKPKDPVHTLSVWHRRSFEQALSYLESYSEALDVIDRTPESPRRLAPSSLQRWGFHILLTASSLISRHSQGKANLFVVNSLSHENGKPIASLRSQYFVGAFPLWQLKEKGVYEYRDMAVSDDTQEHARSVAGKAAFYDRISFDPLGTNFLSDAETRLRTNYILAIPICEGIKALDRGDAAVITVDLRLPNWIRLLNKASAWPGRKRIERRAAEVQKAAREFAAKLPDEGQLND